MFLIFSSPEQLLHYIRALHCGTMVSINSTLQNHLVCILTFLSTLNFVTFSSVNVRHPPTMLELVCRVGWWYSIGYLKSGLETGLDYNGPGLIIGVHSIVRTQCRSTKDDLWWVKKRITFMELGRPLKGWASVKNSVLWSSRPWPPYWTISESSLILYLTKIDVKAQ